MIQEFCSRFCVKSVVIIADNDKTKRINYGIDGANKLSGMLKCPSAIITPLRGNDLKDWWHTGKLDPKIIEILTENAIWR